MATSLPGGKLSRQLLPSWFLADRLAAECQRFTVPFKGLQRDDNEPKIKARNGLHGPCAQSPKVKLWEARLLEIWLGP